LRLCKYIDATGKAFSRLTESERAMNTTRTVVAAGLAVIVMLFSVPASAGVIRIDIAGLDLKYDGVDVFDARSKAGGVGNPADADPLARLIFSYVENPGPSEVRTELGVLDADIYADVLVSGLTIPATPQWVTSSGGGYFDILTTAAVPGFGLGLNVQSASIFYGNGLVMALSTKATSIRTQNLPFSIVLEEGDPVMIGVVCSNAQGVVVGSQVSQFTASGTANLATAGVPEPAAIAQLAALLAGGLGWLVYRRGLVRVGG